MNDSMLTILIYNLNHQYFVCMIYILKVCDKVEKMGWDYHIMTNRLLIIAKYIPLNKIRTLMTVPDLQNLRVFIKLISLFDVYTN